eukprot:4072877-Pleurochrysis_carterae.AAC.5
MHVSLSLIFVFRQMCILEVNRISNIHTLRSSSILSDGFGLAAEWACCTCGASQKEADLTSVAPPPSERGGRAPSMRSSVERVVDEDEEVLRGLTKLGTDLGSLLAEIDAGTRRNHPPKT